MNQLPPPIVEGRKSICGTCSCQVDFQDGCSQCPHGLWGPTFCDQSDEAFLPVADPSLPPQAPNLATMAATLAKSSVQWAKRGFSHTPEETLHERLEICQACEWWDSKAFKGTGRCMKCGCSTWAKLRMATEKCPIGKWGPVS